MNTEQAHATCAHCGKVLNRPVRADSRPRFCKARVCVLAYRRWRRAQVARATCAHCGKTLRYPPRRTGRPSFCAAPVCRRAECSWRWQYDPLYRQAHSRYYRRSPRLPIALLGPKDDRQQRAQQLAAAGWSQGEIARALGMSRSGIYRYLHAEGRDAA